jgi:hypothetical protein
MKEQKNIMKLILLIPFELTTNSTNLKTDEHLQSNDVEVAVEVKVRVEVEVGDTSKDQEKEIQEENESDAKIDVPTRNYNRKINTNIC